MRAGVVKPVNEMSLAEYEAAVRLTWSENELLTDIIRRAHEHHWRVAHFRAVKSQRRDGTARWLTPVQADGAGWPDLAMVRRGRLLFVELKAKGGAISAEQAVWLRELSATSCPALVWTTRTAVAEIEEVLQ